MKLIPKVIDSTRSSSIFSDLEKSKIPRHIVYKNAENYIEQITASSKCILQTKIGPKYGNGTIVLENN